MQLKSVSLISSLVKTIVAKMYQSSLRGPKVSCLFTIWVWFKVLLISWGIFNFSMKINTQIFCEFDPEKIVTIFYNYCFDKWWNVRYRFKLHFFNVQEIFWLFYICIFLNQMLWSSKNERNMSSSHHQLWQNPKL